MPVANKSYCCADNRVSANTKITAVTPKPTETIWRNFFRERLKLSSL